jgi:ABC-2 type transport system permease protein
MDGDGTGAVVVDGLRKVYGEVVAVDHASLAVSEGEIFGILGPNGAGKTTTVECLRAPHSRPGGRVRRADRSSHPRKCCRADSSMSTPATLVRGSAPRSAFSKLLESETKMAWRLPIGLVLGVAVPILLVVIFGNVPGMNRSEGKLGGLTYFDVYFPIVIALYVAILALVSLPTHLADYRDKGILRRLSTMPLSPSWMLAAQLVVSLALTAVSLSIVVALGTTAYGLGAPKELGGFVLAVLLTVAAMFAIGLLLASFARSGTVASGLGQLLLYPMLFFAGLWVPREVMTPELRDIGDWSPLGAAVQGMQTSMQGGFPSVQSLPVMVAYPAILSVLAVRFFRWE